MRRHWVHVFCGKNFKKHGLVMHNVLCTMCYDRWGVSSAKILTARCLSESQMPAPVKGNGNVFI